MFKSSNYFDKANFVKRKWRWKKINVDKNMFFLKKKIFFNKKNILKSLELLFKRVKKKKYTFFINLRLNLIKSFKSKNSRMGKGKGVFSNQLLLIHTRDIIRVNQVSLTRKKKLFIFLKKKIY